MVKQHFRWITLVIGVCLTLHHDVSVAVNPGLTLAVSEKGLNYAASVAIDQLAKDVQGKTVPDLHGNTHVAIGKIDYDITGMRVTGFTRPTSSIAINQGTGVTWALTNLGASLRGDWRYKYKKAFIKISDHGSFDVKVTGTSVKVAIRMGLDPTGRPTISMASCDCHVGDVSVHFHGGASWLYNLFKNLVERPISDKLKSLLCDSVGKAINTDAAKSLAKMKIQVPIEGLLTLDYRLVAPPVFGHNYIETLHKGEFFWTASQTEAPFQPQPMAVAGGTQKMVTICMADYVTSSLGYVLFKYGGRYLAYNLTKKDLPPADQHFLNTATIPPLAKKYPNGSIEIAMWASAAPALHTAPTVIFGHFQGEMDFNVRLPDGSLHEGFKGNVSARVVLAVNLTGSRISAHVKTPIKFTASIIHSEVGPIPDVVLQLLLTAAANGFIIPKLNEVGEKGFEIPSIDKVALLNPDITFNKGSLCVMTDAKYDPTLRFEGHHKVDLRPAINRLHRLG